MARFAVVNNKEQVVNVVMWDEKSAWTPPKGCTLVKSDAANPGDKYDIIKNTFTHLSAEEMIEFRENRKKSRK